MTILCILNLCSAHEDNTSTNAQIQYSPKESTAPSPQNYEVISRYSYGKQDKSPSSSLGNAPVVATGKIANFTTYPSQPANSQFYVRADNSSSLLFQTVFSSVKHIPAQYTNNNESYQAMDSQVSYLSSPPQSTTPISFPLYYGSFKRLSNDKDKLPSSREIVPSSYFVKNPYATSLVADSASAYYLGNRERTTSDIPVYSYDKYSMSQPTFNSILVPAKELSIPAEPHPLFPPPTSNPFASEMLTTHSLMMKYPTEPDIHSREFYRSSALPPTRSDNHIDADFMKSFGEQPHSIPAGNGLTSPSVMTTPEYASYPPPIEKLSLVEDNHDLGKVSVVQDERGKHSHRGYPHHPHNHHSIPAAIHSKHVVETYKSKSHHDHHHHKPIIDINSDSLSLTLRFNSHSSDVHTLQNHQSKQGKVKKVHTYDEPDLLIHTVRKPIIQEIREIILPYRQRTQEVRPVKEKIETLIAKDDTPHHHEHKHHPYDDFYQMHGHYKYHPSMFDSPSSSFVNNTMVPQII